MKALSQKELEKLSQEELAAYEAFWSEYVELNNEKVQAHIEVLEKEMLKYVYTDNSIE